MPSPDVAIAGAGVAGLACALTLQQAGRKVLLVEAADEVGGRVRSYRAGDFVLDRGFQVLLTAYPTCRDLLDYDALKLGLFSPGALIRSASGECAVGDPFRRPRELFSTLRAPVGTLRDKWLMGKLSLQLRFAAPSFPWQAENVTTEEWLRKYGFSPQMMATFFRPFLSGIFLEKELNTSARMFLFVFRNFAIGAAALPAGGMGEIPRRMALRVGSERVWLNARVAEVQPGLMRLQDGREVRAKHVVVAVDGEQVRRWFPALPVRRWNGGTCYYYDAPQSRFIRRRRRLWLNATGQGRVNHIAVPSDVARGYAPLGRALICVNTVGDADAPAAEEAIRAELAGYFGDAVAHWKFLRSFPVPRSLPRLSPEDVAATAKPPGLPPGLHMCGDVLGAGSLETAMASGVAAAKAILAS